MSMVAEGGQPPRRPRTMPLTRPPAITSRPPPSTMAAAKVECRRPPLYTMAAANIEYRRPLLYTMDGRHSIKWWPPAFYFGGCHSRKWRPPSCGRQPPDYSRRPHKRHCTRPPRRLTPLGHHTCLNHVAGSKA